MWKPKKREELYYQFLDDMRSKRYKHKNKNISLRIIFFTLNVYIEPMATPYRFKLCTNCFMVFTTKFPRYGYDHNGSTVNGKCDICHIQKPLKEM